MVSKAMIMAAGAGSRLNPLTLEVPKPLIPVANSPVMEITVNHLIKYGITDIVANTHTLASQIHDKFKDNESINFEYVYEGQLSGTAGGVKKCEYFFDKGEDFIVISGDALTDINLNTIINAHKNNNAIATIALKEVPIEDVHLYGVVITDENSKITEFQEKPPVEEAKSNLVNTGIYVFNSKIFDYIPISSFYDFAKNVFPALLENNEKFHGFKIDDYWNDIGTFEQYKATTVDILLNKVKVDVPHLDFENGWHCESCKVCECVEFYGKAIVGSNSVIENKVKIYGNCVIGNNCTIKANAVLKDVILWDNITIEENAHLENCIIGNDVTIASFEKLNGEIITNSQLSKI